MNSLSAQLDGTNMDISGHDLLHPALRFNDEIAVIIDIGCRPGKGSVDRTHRNLLSEHARKDSPLRQDRSKAFLTDRMIQLL